MSADGPCRTQLIIMLIKIIKIISLMIIMIIKIIIARILCNWRVFYSLHVIYRGIMACVRIFEGGVL